MDPGIRSLVLSRLEAVGSAPGAWGGRVLAALEGRGALEAELSGNAASPREGRRANALGEGGGVSPLDRRRGVPRDRSPADAGAPAGPGLTLVVGPQRLRQVELRRGARGAPHRRQPALEGASRGLARGLAQPPPSRGLARRDVPRRGRAGTVRGVAPVGAGAAFEAADASAQLHGKPVSARVPRLDRGAAHPPSLPLLQRAGLAPRRRSLEALRRPLLDPGSRGSRRGPGRAPGGPAVPREGPEGRHRRTGAPARAAARCRRRPRAAGGGGPRRQGVGPGRGRRGARRARVLGGGSAEADVLRGIASLEPPEPARVAAAVTEMRGAAAALRPPGRRPRPGPATRPRFSSAPFVYHGPRRWRLPGVRPQGRPRRRLERAAAQCRGRLREAAREADAVHERAEAARRQWEGLRR